jgi:hypothetical protein
VMDKGRRTAAQTTTQVALRPDRGGGAQEGGRYGALRGRGRAVTTRVPGLLQADAVQAAGEEMKRCKNDHVPARE